MTVRGIPEDLFRQAKSAAALQGQTLREWIIEAMTSRLGTSPAEPEATDDDIPF